MGTNLTNDTTTTVDNVPLRFTDLVERYGSERALGILHTIEELARIQDEMAKAVDNYDARLQRAMGRLESINFSQMA